MRKALFFLAVPIAWAGIAMVTPDPAEGGLIFHRGARRGYAGYTSCSGVRMVRAACCCEEPVQVNYGCSGTQIMSYGSAQELRQPLPPAPAPRLAPLPDDNPDEASGNSGPIPDTDGSLIPPRPAPATFTPPLPRE